MIVVCPKWCIFPQHGGYFVGLKSGGMMIWGSTIENAKKAFIEEKAKEEREFWYEEIQHHR
jgi:hypothetical protein